MTTARLRKAFRFPEDDEHDPGELDEEEQEKLIADLQQRDHDNNRFYTIVFTFPPAGSALYSVVTLLTANHPRGYGVAVLSLAIYVATAYILLRIPLGSPDTKGKKPVYLAEQESSWLGRWLPWVTAALAGVLLVTTIIFWRRGRYESAGVTAWPVAVFVLTMVAREQLRPLQWQELQQARYELKGA